MATVAVSREGDGAVAKRSLDGERRARLLLGWSSRRETTVRPRGRRRALYVEGAQTATFGRQMDLCDEIVRRRDSGKVRCGIREHRGTPTVSDVARSFELFEDAGRYRQVTAAQGLAIPIRILHRDMAYDSELMTRGDAVMLAGAFLERASSSACSYFSNGDSSKSRRRTAGIRRRWRRSIPAS